MLFLYQDSRLEPKKSNQVTTTYYSIGSHTKQVKRLHMILSLETSYVIPFSGSTSSYL